MIGDEFISGRDCAEIKRSRFPIRSIFMEIIMARRAIPRKVPKFRENTFIASGQTRHEINRRHRCTLMWNFNAFCHPMYSRYLFPSSQSPFFFQQWRVRATVEKREEENRYELGIANRLRSHNFKKFQISPVVNFEDQTMSLPQLLRLENDNLRSVDRKLVS